MSARRRGRLPGAQLHAGVCRGAGHVPERLAGSEVMATLRSGEGVPCGFRATGNPGGPGHQWVKARYIDPNPAGWEIRKLTYEIRGRATRSSRIASSFRASCDPACI